MNLDEHIGFMDPDELIDKLIRESDETVMSLPNIENNPHLLISKVRKHYMDYLIKLLSVNYENNQKLLNKNIYLPSAIWRCAKIMESKAAQAAMMVELYRKNILMEIQALKKDTKNGKLNRKLYECLHLPPNNERKTQTTGSNVESCNCQCDCGRTKKRRKVPESSTLLNKMNTREATSVVDLPLTSTSQSESKDITDLFVTSTSGNEQHNISSSSQNLDLNQDLCLKMFETLKSHDSDDLMLKMDQLFQGDPNDEDIFEGSLCDTSTTMFEDNTMKSLDAWNPATVPKQDNIIESHAAQIKSLDERISSLAGLFTNNAADESIPQKTETPKTTNTKCLPKKWLCEEYFLRSRFFELLDQIGDSNRKKLKRIKQKLIALFGDDNEDEGVVSPLEETPEFVISCKERIAPWVVNILTPYYIKGRIRGKSLFKQLAKHLIRLIYQCSKYPSEYDVNSFVSDFLGSHKMIRSEADFKQFKIQNY